MVTLESRQTANRFTMSFANAATSSEANLDGRYPTAILNDATGPTSLTFEVLDVDDATWIPVNENGSDITVTLEAAKSLEVLPDSLVKALMGRRCRLKAGSSITKTLYLYTGT